MIIGLDVGGTHTDVALLGNEGLANQIKVPTDSSELYHSVLTGLDFSRIREPDYDPQRMRQSTQVTEAIKKVCDLVLDLWQQRRDLRHRIVEQSDFFERARSIFYDTDHISETQKETIRVCEDCGGAWRIDSSSDRGSHILAVHIPSQACIACTDQGYKWYESADLDAFDHVCLQDRPADRYLLRKSK